MAAGYCRALLFIGILVLSCGCISPGPVCNKPYIIRGMGCCLDVNGDSICDSDVPPTTAAMPATTLRMEAVATTSSTTSSTAAPPTTTYRIYTTTTTVPARITCSMNSDCGGERNASAYCRRSPVNGMETNTIAADILVPLCESPGTVNSTCSFKRVQRTVETCYDGMCFKGACYPATCGNGLLDYNEVDMDCGGACPPCEQVMNKTCNYNRQCGTDHYIEGYTCHNGDVVRDKVQYWCNAGNRSCFSNVTHELVDECGNTTEEESLSCPQGFSCVVGQRQCQCGEGTCDDCVRNQYEEGVDCGGPNCMACAPTPPSGGNIDTYQAMNLTSTRLVFVSRGYEFRFVGPLTKEHCTFGARILVKMPDKTTTEVNVTRYANANADSRMLGYFSGDDDSAIIWATI